jgi:hypothetical protein
MDKHQWAALIGTGPIVAQAADVPNAQDAALAIDGIGK